MENTINRIQELQLAFSQSLTIRIEELFQSTQQLDTQHPPSAENNNALLIETHNLAHTLAGTAGTFQFTDVYDLAKNLELFCSHLLDTNTPFPEDWLTQIQQLLAELRQASDNKNKALPLRRKSFVSIDNSDFLTSKASKIILVDDDVLVSSLIQEQAKHFGYQIHCITKPEEFSDYLSNNSPEVILMDIVFPNSSLNGIDLVKQLKADDKIHCPVIFLSNKDDFNARLNAVRAGGNGYIVKPVNTLELVEILNKYTHSKVSTNYRALIIDDDPIVMQFYKKKLEAHNFTCQTITKPLTTTEELVTFEPDIILLDINMPECNGFEVAEVIRQDTRFTHIPIIFLTGDNSAECEIAALKAGGNCFLSKNTNKETFIANAISHSKRSQELHAVINRLRKNEFRFQAVSNSTSDAIITLNKEGLIILWNKGAENIFGYQSLEVFGQSIEIIIPDQHQEKHHQGFKKLLSGNGPVNKHSIESQAITKDQRLINIELTYTEWLSGSERFYTSIIRDTTHRKEIEKELKNQQDNLKAIVSCSAEGIITIDDRGIIEMANPKALEIFAYTAEELEGKNISTLMPKAMRSQHDQYLKHSEIHAPKIINKARELQGLRKDGSVFPMELNVSPMTLNGVKKYIGVLHDITSRKNTLAAITAAKHEAENANKAKSQFLSSMSHELRTPLNAVLGFTQLLQEDQDAPLNEDQNDSLGHIYSAGQHLLNLIDEVLDLSKIESGKINIAHDSINLIKLLKQSLELISPQARRSQITLVNKCPAEESVFVLADTFRLNQVFSNLLTNAIKYNQIHGSISVWLSQNNNKVRIYVKDTGGGIPDEMMKDLFIPFNRLGAEQSGIEGTGIGLTISKMLVEMMGGTIGVENIYGKGCTFWVELDRAEINDVTKTTEALSIHPEHKQQKTPSIALLYIEDNPANRLLMKKIINTHTDFNYVEACTGTEGVESALKIKPQIILLDINLPDMDGYEVFEQLQQNKLTETSKIIVVSANAMPIDIAKGKETGFFDYVTKPIDHQQLLSTVNKALEALL